MERTDGDEADQKPMDPDKLQRFNRTGPMGKTGRVPKGGGLKKKKIVGGLVCSGGGKISRGGKKSGSEIRVGGLKNSTGGGTSL